VDVGVQNGAHGQRARRLSCCFAQPVALPEALEQIEPEVAPQRLLDHLAVAPAAAGRTDLDRAQDILVDGKRRAYPCHEFIMAP
jgi:hypothetical protein